MERATTYVAKRDHRFEYAADACAYIEQHQCKEGCVNAEPQGDDYPGGSCPVLVTIICEDPLEGVLGEGPDVLDLGNLGIRCTRWSKP